MSYGRFVWCVYKPTGIIIVSAKLYVASLNILNVKAKPEVGFYKQHDLFQLAFGVFKPRVCSTRFFIGSALFFSMYHTDSAN